MILTDPVSNSSRYSQEIRQDTPTQEAAQRNNPNPMEKVSPPKKNSRSNPTNKRLEDKDKEDPDYKKRDRSEEDTSTKMNKQKNDNLKVEKIRNKKTGVFVDELA